MRAIHRAISLATEPSAHRACNTPCMLRVLVFSFITLGRWCSSSDRGAKGAWAGAGESAGPLHMILSINVRHMFLSVKAESSRAVPLGIAHRTTFPES